MIYKMSTAQNQSSSFCFAFQFPNIVAETSDGKLTLYDYLGKSTCDASISSDLDESHCLLFSLP